MNDPEEITISHNGSDQGRAFVERFHRISAEIDRMDEARRKLMFDFGCAHVAVWDAWFKLKDAGNAVLVPAFGKGSREFATGSLVGVIDGNAGHVFRVKGIRPWMVALDADHRDILVEFVKTVGLPR